MACRKTGVHNRSAGDVGDFLTLGLLRWLTEPSPFARPVRLGMISFLGFSQRATDGGADLGYLDHSSAAGEELRPLDPHLYDRLGRLVATGDRSVRALVSSGVLPADTVTYDQELTVEDLPARDRAARAVHRERWFHSAMVAVDQCSLVFVDLDDAEEHAYLPELRQLLDRGQSVVSTYRAQPSDSAAAQATERMSELHLALGVEPLAVLRSARDATLAFTVVPTAEHRSDLEASLGALQLSSWGDELRLYRWNKAVLTV
jgi:hypothetical protein